MSTINRGLGRFFRINIKP